MVPKAGIAAFDVSGVYGVVRGYAVPSTATGRAALQPLMLAHGVEAVERAGVLVFRMRDARDRVVLDSAGLVARDGGDLHVTRASQPDTAGRLRLTYIEAEGSFETRSAEAVFPDENAGDVASSELPLTLTRGEARTAVKRWLAESRVARDVARFGLPMSSTLGAGDVVTLAHDGAPRHYRIDRVELTGAREIEATRVEPGISRHMDGSDDLPLVPAHDAPVPVLPVFLDLPLLTGDEVPHAPWLAVAGRPWPGAVAAYDAPAAGGSFALNTTLTQRASIGITRTSLFRAQPSLIQRGAGVEIEFPASADLASIDPAELLSGANLAAIGTGAGWELFQYTNADLVAPGLWRLSGLLRGQSGTEPLIPDTWAPGAVVVLLDGAPAQVALPSSARGVARRWRIGPAALAYDDPTYVDSTEAFAGNGLRPYAPAFLSGGRATPGADLEIGWVRRTRLGGDGWDGGEVPLSEDSESYLLRVRQGGAVRREEVLATRSYSYSAADQAADGVTGPFTISVAQVSALFGPGLFAEIEVPG